MSEACDLCGAVELRALPRPAGNRALRSDRRVVVGSLAKVECQRCGLVRDASPTAATPVYYRDEYRLDESDHVFHAVDGAHRRSAVFADWICQALAASGQPGAPRRVLEIGASRGHLLAELATRWPQAVCEGVELGVEAAAEARALGLNVRQGDTAALADAQYDVILAIAVVEHVPSPTAFIAEIRRLLAPGGRVVLIQPTQDVPSYDVFFVDHLHHFATAHLRGYSEKLGFTECYSQVGFAFMPNFSAHAWALAASPPASWQWDSAPAGTSCAQALDTVLADLWRLDQEATALTHSGHRFAVFGLHEVFALVRAYSSLEATGIACGLDDSPDKTEYRAYSFPVMRPEDCAATGVRDVFLTMNRIYYGLASERLRTLGLVAHPVLS